MIRIFLMIAALGTVAACMPTGSSTMSGTGDGLDNTSDGFSNETTVE